MLASQPGLVNELREFKSFEEGGGGTEKPLAKKPKHISNAPVMYRMRQLICRMRQFIHRMRPPFIECASSFYEREFAKFQVYESSFSNETNIFIYVYMCTLILYVLCMFSGGAGGLDPWGAWVHGMTGVRAGRGATYPVDEEQ